MPVDENVWVMSLFHDAVRYPPSLLKLTWRFLTTLPVLFTNKFELNLKRMVLPW